MFSMSDQTELLQVLDYFDVPMFAADRSALDAPFRFVGLNAAHTAATTLTTAMVAGRTPHDILSSDDADAVARHYDTCATTGRTVSYSETLNIAGQTRHWRTSLQPVVLASGGGRIIGIAMEIRDPSQMIAMSDTTYYAAQAQLKIGQLETFLSYLEHRTDLPLDARSQAMMMAGLTRSLDAVLADIQTLTARQMHQLPQGDQDARAIPTADRPQPSWPADGPTRRMN